MTGSLAARAAQVFGSEMDFTLRYFGGLPAHKKCAPEKNAIRTKLHYQLRNLCEAQPLLSGVLDSHIKTARLVGRTMNVDHLRKSQRPGDAPVLGPNLFFKVVIGKYHFIPLVTRPHELTCELEIRWGRRERAGSLVHDGGDLDNRLKNLLDALRMPHNDDEIKGLQKSFGDESMVCLLEDDSLITKISIETYRIWEPMGLLALADGRKETDVQIDLHVTVKSSHPMWANLGFPSAGV